MFVCYWCKYDQGLVDIPAYLISKYKFVFSLCNFTEILKIVTIS